MRDPKTKTLRFVDQLAKPLGPGARPGTGIFLDAIGESGDRRVAAVEHAVVSVLP